MSQSTPRRCPGGGVAVLLALNLLLTSALQASAETIWFRDTRPTRQALQVLEVLRTAETYGLRTADYETGLDADEVSSVIAGQADTALRMRFDVALSAAVSRFVTHLHRGRVSAQAAGFHLPAAEREFDVTRAVDQLATTSDVKATLASMEPQPLTYRRLKNALARYRALASQPELTHLPAPPRRSIKPGDDYEGASQLRALLVALGDLEAQDAEANHEDHRMDAAVVAALQRFQSRHGLEADGVIGPRTFAALTTPLARRVRQIELALERWRWLTSLERPDIVVNIPQFVLYALPRAGDPAARMLEMPVIVGRSDPHTRTPIFVAAIQQVIFQPYWDIPFSIMRGELLPHIRKDPGYLERHHMEIVRGPGDDAKVLAPTAEVIDALAAGRLRLRQRPGPDNALGPVKFVLPNPYSVYLHATPEQVLFQRSRRTFSHGCIRVSEPAALAEYVLRNAPGDWNTAAIEAALCGTKTLRVALATPVRVVIIYSTVAASESKGVLFFEDVYGDDRRLEELLSTQEARTPEGRGS